MRNRQLDLEDSQNDPLTVIHLLEIVDPMISASLLWSAYVSMKKATGKRERQ